MKLLLALLIFSSWNTQASPLSIQEQVLIANAGTAYGEDQRGESCVVHVEPIHYAVGKSEDFSPGVIQMKKMGSLKHPNLAIPPYAHGTELLAKPDSVLEASAHPIVSGPQIGYRISNPRPSVGIYQIQYRSNLKILRVSLITHQSESVCFFR